MIKNQPKKPLTPALPVNLKNKTTENDIARNWIKKQLSYYIIPNWGHLTKSQLLLSFAAILSSPFSLLLLSTLTTRPLSSIHSTTIFNPPKTKTNSNSQTPIFFFKEKKIQYFKTKFHFCYRSQTPTFWSVTDYPKVVTFPFLFFFFLNLNFLGKQFSRKSFSCN